MDELVKRAHTVAACLIVKGRTTSEFSLLNRAWHKPGNTIPYQIRPLLGVGEWYSFIEPQSFDRGFTVEALWSHAELKREGDLLGHCLGAGSHTAACRDGRCHILSIRKDGVPIATVELKRSKTMSDFHSPDGTYWQRGQFTIVADESIEAAARNIWDRFVQRVSDRTITLNSRHGLVKPNARSEVNLTGGYEPVEIRMGYLANEYPRAFRSILSHYSLRLSGLLPADITPNMIAQVNPNEM